MSEIAAQKKYACPSCGGEAQWNPTKQALTCPYCGTESPAEISAEGEIREHELAAALRGVDADHRGWQAEKTTVKCQSCQAITVFDPSRAAQRCDFCGSSAIVPLEQQLRPIRPESLLEFKKGETWVREAVRSWFGSHFWAPGNLKGRALTDTLHGLYIPYWTFDASVDANWDADAGYYYYTTESYQDSQGRTQTRQVRHTRWEPASGSITGTFDDELVPASKGVMPELLRGVEPFPTTSDLKPYDPAFLSGWVVEQYQIDLVAAATQARNQMDIKVRAKCAAAVPGDTQRNLQVDAHYADQTFKHVLVPVWIVAYNYGAQRYQVVINGYTGKMAGKYPLSWIKITIAILLAVALIIGFMAMQQ